MDAIQRSVSNEDFEAEVIRAYNAIRKALQDHIAADYGNIERRVAVATALKAFSEITRSTYGLHNEHLIDRASNAIVETVMSEQELSKPPKAKA